ncbi:MAG: hypothetical protein IPI32_05835 [Austwickia sp.]|nr:hypothetical protein [Austwickia sp.]MBK9102956.1 hypothetical protein [Austwickia sp.]
MLELIDELTQLTAASDMDEWRAKLTAARLRHEKALVDHAEAAAATRALEESRHGVLRFPSPRLSNAHPDHHPEAAEPAQETDEEFWPDYREMV